MTWTLHLYDADGVEIGRVTASPFEWEFHEPRPARTGLRETITRLREIYPDHDNDQPETEIEGIDITFCPGPLALEPKEHLERIENAVEDMVASTELTDE
jgi:hypothetical protein